MIIYYKRTKINVTFNLYTLLSAYGLIDRVNISIKYSFHLSLNLPTVNKLRESYLNLFASAYKFEEALL